MEKKKNNAVEKMENIMNNNASLGDEKDEVLREEKARARLHEKEEKQRKKAMLKREKIRKKKERDEKIERIKKERKENKNKNVGYISAIISLSVATLSLACLLTYNFVMPSSEEKALEASYQRAFYDTVKEVDTIDVNLSKALATADTASMQNYLVDVSINAELLENNVQSLPLSDESKFNTTKLINQVGDYSKYLNKKLNAGESLTKEDRDTLYKLYQLNLNLKEMLDESAKNMGGDFSFISMMDEKKTNALRDGFNRLENLSVEYPELIYDGPFSDGKDAREIKGLTGEDIDLSIAKEIFSKAFSDYEVKDVKALGKTNSAIECYAVQGLVKGQTLYAQITVKGGKLAMFAYAGSCNDTLVEQEQATSKAQEFLSKVGYNDMKPVWINLADSVYTINFAVEKGGVVCYPDLVKVRVCAQTNMVIGLEATSYLTNHVERKIPSPVITSVVAESLLSKDMLILSSRLCVVPKGEQSEELCYEFECSFNGDTYYVYISAISGKQIEMFKVISSTEGDLLM